MAKTKKQGSGYKDYKLLESAALFAVLRAVSVGNDTQGKIIQATGKPQQSLAEQIGFLVDNKLVSYTRPGKTKHYAISFIGIQNQFKKWLFLIPTTHKTTLNKEAKKFMQQAKQHDISIAIPTKQSLKKDFENLENQTIFKKLFLRFLAVPSVHNLETVFLLLLPGLAAISKMLTLKTRFLFCESVWNDLIEQAAKNEK